jgi:DNA-directed RNA polymerase subunit N (RpoN/RPB10)
MIIPLLCFTCGKPIADRWEEYSHMVKLYKKKPELYNKFLEDNNIIKSGDYTVEGNVLIYLGMDRYCCRRMFLCQPIHLVNMLKNRKIV